MKSFNEKIKEEILAKKFNKKEFRLLLLFFFNQNTLIKYNKKNKQYNLIISSFLETNIVFLNYYLKKHFNITSKIISPNLEKGLWKLVFLKQEDIDFLIQLSYDINSKDFWKNNLKKLNFCLMGSFLASGVICDFEKKIFHSEIAFKNFDVAEMVSKILQHYNIPNKIFQYRTFSKIYIKKTDAISDLLKALKAFDAMSYLDEIKITSDYINQSQRLANLDVANLAKTTKSFVEQKKIILFLKKIKKLETLDLKTRIFAETRLKNPSASLSQMVEILKKEHKIFLTKSGLNHCTRKLKKIYLDNQKINISTI